MSTTNLSKNWHIEDALGLLRSLANEIAPDRIQDPQLVDFLHLSICDVAELLSAADFPDYGVKQSVSQVSDVIDISSYNIATITKLVDGTNGLCIEVRAKELDGLVAIPQKQFNVYFSQFGEHLYLYKPSALTYGTLTLYYNRVPTKVSTTGDTLDIRDKYVKLAIDKAKIMLYELLKQTVPEALTNSVNSSVAAIRDANIAELSVVS